VLTQTLTDGLPLFCPATAAESVAVVGLDFAGVQTVPNINTTRRQERARYFRMDG
jgi:hypothetical protein